MKLVQLNVAFDPRLETPDRLLDTYHTLVGWSDALTDAGVSVAVVQAYLRDADLHRRGVEYLFREAGEKATSALTAAVVSSGPDIVHINGFDAARMTASLRRALPTGVPIVMQHHGGAPPRRFTSGGRSVRRTMALADGFLFTSRPQAETWIERGFIPRSEMVHEVLEASTTLVPIQSSAAKARTGTAGLPAVLWVGRLDANKDPLTVLRGFELALNELPDATLTMVFGSDALTGQVSRQVRESDHLRARVRLVGAVPYADMATWYSASDLFVLGSHHEACGYALLEACACGVTPVVTDIAPFRAITGDGSIGRLWSVGDAEACGAAIVSAARALGEHGRRAILDRFRSALSWKAVGACARAVYEGVLAERATEDSATAAC